MKDFKEIQTELLERYQKDNQSAQAGGTLLLGDSLVEFLPTNHLKLPQPIYNHGIRGIDCAFLAQHLQELIKGLTPDNIILLIGTNDLMREREPRSVAADISQILRALETAFPKATCYIESIYPRRRSEKYGSALADEVAELNLYLRQETSNYLDVYSHLLGEAGQLPKELTHDGVHLTYAAYQKVIRVLEEAIY